MEPQEYLSTHYSKVRLIHRGNTTEIWLVIEIATGREYVFKKIERVGTPYPQILDLRHSNLPIVYYAVETENMTYVIEEYLQGLNLQEYIKKYGEFEEDEICNYAIEICDCLELLHTHHILHRDIKPSNLFLTENHKLKLIDFDAGRIGKANKENDTQIIGTPGFASPEQYGFQQTDERSDIYSLGLTLQMLLGYDNYNGFMLPIFKKCTEFDPSKRYSSARELNRAIKIRGYYYFWRRKLVNSKTLGVGICVLCFFIKEAITPNLVSEIKLELIPTAIETPQSANQPETVHQESELPADEPLQKEEGQQNKKTEFDTNLTWQDPVISPESPAESKSIPTSTDSSSQYNHNLKPPARDLEAFYQRASTMPIEIHRMTREERKMQMKNQPEMTAEEALDKWEIEQDIQNKRIELGQRAIAFEEMLPDDMTAQEKNAAYEEFIRREKIILGLQD